jgi:hypothetical protein
MAAFKLYDSYHGMARPRVADGGYGLQIWRVVANILNKQSHTADKGWSSGFWIGRRANISSLKKQTCYEMLHR